MKRMAALVGVLLVSAAIGLAQTKIETEPFRAWVPDHNLKTCKYKPTATEQDFYASLAPGELRTGSIVEDYDIFKKAGYVSWYGIVRGITKVDDRHWRLLLEHKFFDGLTDCHIMLVDISGSGDFLANVQAGDLTIPALALVRVYGTITGQEDGRPALGAEYIRVWPWLTFTFTALISKDRTNQKWKEACSVNRRKVYRPYPDEGYYRAVLGDPAEYGLAFKDK